MDWDAIWTASVAQKLVTGHSELHLGHTARSGGKSGAAQTSICYSRGQKGCCEEICVTVAGQFIPEAQQVHLTFLYI